MIDQHLTLLRLIAKRAGGALDEHDRSGRSADTKRMDRRKRLERIARRAAGQLAQAEARRQKRPKAQGS
jgi:hypothetical protein